MPQCQMLSFLFPPCTVQGSVYLRSLRKPSLTRVLTQPLLDSKEESTMRRVRLFIKPWPCTCPPNPDTQAPPSRPPTARACRAPCRLRKRFHIISSASAWPRWYHAVGFITIPALQAANAIGTWAPQSALLRTQMHLQDVQRQSGSPRAFVWNTHSTANLSRDRAVVVSSPNSSRIERSHC